MSSPGSTRGRRAPLAAYGRRPPSPAAHAIYMYLYIRISLYICMYICMHVYIYVLTW